ncbi:hypothetical protein ACQ5SO_17305 [Rhodovulum sp. DZ06]|uniref:hypothetical protein n=1 Tax=Rhodovulum sp. DZ06 TaxID=3425126 RepID=UPI003D32E4EB
MRSAPAWTRPAAAMLLTLALLPSACARPGGSATEAAMCRELRAALPSWSEEDTARTLDDGASFMAVFEGVCGEGAR